MSQYGEPWNTAVCADDRSEDAIACQTRDGLTQAMVCNWRALLYQKEDVASRIVACVNFCRLLPDELLEQAVAFDISQMEGLESVVPNIPNCKALMAVAHAKEEEKSA